MNGLMTTKEAAEKLQVSTTTLYKYIREGKLKAHKLGGNSSKRRWRIYRSDLEEFIQNTNEL